MSQSKLALGRIKNSLWIPVLVLVSLFLFVLGETPINPRVDDYLENAVAFLATGERLWVEKYEWPAYFWVAVASAQLFGSSALPLIALNIGFLIVTIGILLRFAGHLPTRQRQILALCMILFPENLLFLVSPSKDSILSSALVAGVALWIQLHQRRVGSNQSANIMLLAFLVIAITLLRPTAILMLGFTLSVVSILFWVSHRITFTYLMAPAIVSLGLFWVGREISVLLGGVGKEAYDQVSLTIGGYGESRESQWFESYSGTGDSTASLSTALLPDSGFETLFMGILRAPLLLFAPFGSISALQGVDSRPLSFQAMYWAALISSVVLLALTPFWIRALKAPLRGPASLKDMQALTVAALTMLTSIAVALPIIHERYRLPASFLLAFTGMYFFLRWPASRRRRTLAIALPLVAGSILWCFRTLLH